jgi:hypothetical protein
LPQLAGQPLCRPPPRPAAGLRPGNAPVACRITPARRHRLAFDVPVRPSRLLVPAGGLTGEAVEIGVDGPLSTADERTHGPVVGALPCELVWCRATHRMVPGALVL